MKVSAYIPIFNNAGTIERSLGALLALRERSSDVFVIDDGSTDKGPELVRRMGVTVHSLGRNYGRGRARREAFQIARNEWVLGCDATNTLDADFIPRALNWLREDSVAGVYGRFTQSPARTTAERWRGRHLFKCDAQENSNVDHDATLRTHASLLRKSSVMDAGNFNAELRHSEDFELGQRLRAKSFRVVYDPELKVCSIARNGWMSVLERYWRWHVGVSESCGLRHYARLIAHSAKVLATKDIQEGDWSSAMISMALPHYYFFKTNARKLGRKSAQ